MPDLVAGRDAGGVVSRVALLARLREAARVTVVSAPPGSGKTVLLRSWISQAGLAERTAWVPAGREERDPQRFWLSVLDALRATAAGSVLVQPVSAARTARSCRDQPSWPVWSRSWRHESSNPDIATAMGRGSSDASLFGCQSCASYPGPSLPGIGLMPRLPGVRVSGHSPCWGDPDTSPESHSLISRTRRDVAVRRRAMIVACLMPGYRT